MARRAYRVSSALCLTVHNHLSTEFPLFSLGWVEGYLRCSDLIRSLTTSLQVSETFPLLKYSTDCFLARESADTEQSNMASATNTGRDVQDKGG